MSGESMRERLSALSRGELIGLVALVGITLLGAGFWYLRSLPKPVEVQEAETGPAVAAPSASASATVPVLVDVAGWVRDPGVYTFEAGARVVDAIDAAGGARPGAELSALNLAAPLVDGTQVLVPKAGEAPPPGVAPPGGTAPGGLVNVNSATAAELETLPGIGEVIAQAIIDHRTENGPFASVEELLDVTGIGDATLENIRELVTV